MLLIRYRISAPYVDFTDGKEYSFIFKVRVIRHFYKWQDTDILEFAGPTVSVATTQLCVMA